MVAELDAKIAEFARAFEQMNAAFIARLTGGFKEPEDYECRPE